MKVSFRSFLKAPLVLFASLFFASCATQYSSEQTLAEDTYMVYKETYKAFAEAEKRYMDILFNLERMPEEEELWIMKRETMLELEHLRELMLQARSDFDDAAKDWDAHLQQRFADMKKQENYKSPNLNRSQEKLSSPGEMSEAEAQQIGKNPMY